MRLLRASGSAELGKVASDSAMQGLWLSDRKVESQLIGEGRSRLPRRGTLGKLGEKEKEPATERKREYTDFGREKEQVADRQGQGCRSSWRAFVLSLGLDDDRRSTSGSGEINLAIFITSVSGSESLTSFTNLFFHFRRPPGFRMAFDPDERNGRFGRIQCEGSQVASSRRKKEMSVPLQKDSESQSKRQSHPRELSEKEKENSFGKAFPFPFGKDDSGVLANCSLCGTEATLFAGPVCSSFSAKACTILQALCWCRQHQQICHFSSSI